jgi:hypothetical protein
MVGQISGWAERSDPISVRALFHAGVDCETVDQRLWHGAAAAILQLLRLVLLFGGRDRD